MGIYTIQLILDIANDTSLISSFATLPASNVVTFLSTVSKIQGFGTITKDLITLLKDAYTNQSNLANDMVTFLKDLGLLFKSQVYQAFANALIALYLPLAAPLIIKEILNDVVGKLAVGPAALLILGTNLLTFFNKVLFAVVSVESQGGSGSNPSAVIANTTAVTGPTPTPTPVVFPSCSSQPPEYPATLDGLNILHGGNAVNDFNVWKPILNATPFYYSYGTNPDAANNIIDVGGLGGLEGIDIQTYLNPYALPAEYFRWIGQNGALYPIQLVNCTP